MKRPHTLVRIGSTIALLLGIIVSSAAVGATAPGQVAGGNTNYTIANVTKGSGFANPQTADKCDVLQYRLRLYNPGPSPLGDVKVEASINNMTPYTSANSTATVYTPDGQTKEVAFQATANISSAQTQKYVAGSTLLLDSAGNVIKSSGSGLGDSITMGGGGIDLGSLGDSVTEYLAFKTQLSCPQPPPPPATPAYSCDKLSIAADGEHAVKITGFTTTATNGASFKSATIKWGDNSAALTTASVEGQTHQYGDYGTYTVMATANFDVNGAPKSASSASCEQQITFSKKQPPVVTPPSAPPATPETPSATTSASAAPESIATSAAQTELVNTGPGQLIGLFVAVSLASGIAYHYYAVRRLAH